MPALHHVHSERKVLKQKILVDGRNDGGDEGTVLPNSRRERGRNSYLRRRIGKV
jgi:hypothetical protein